MINQILARSQILEKAINASVIRNEVIMQNLANVDTPGYKRKDVVFEKYLTKAVENMKNTAGAVNALNKSVLNIEPRIVEEGTQLEMRMDGNNVDIDSESALLVKNQLKYNAMVQLLSDEFKKTLSVINEGRK